MSDYLVQLAEQAQRDRITPSKELDAALARLDEELEALAPVLEVDYVGPGVGVEGKEDVYRLVVRAHEWRIGEHSWSLKICDALPNAGWRAAWSVQGASRARKAMAIARLPEFMAGFAAAVRAAGKADSAAGRRVQEMAAALGAGAV